MIIKALTLIALFVAPTNYEREIAQWRAQQEAELKADDGWLTVVGLWWLKEGDNRVGADQASEIPLPSGAAPRRVGTISLREGQATFRPAPGVPVTLNGKPARETVLKADTDVFAINRLKFFLIDRGGRLGVRMKDNDSAARKEFSGLKWYPVDSSWRIAAKFVPWDKLRTVNYDSVIGEKQVYESPGYVTFRKAGREYRLEPVVDEKELFFVMRDQTSGKTTYGASRFLYADPAKDGVVVLDFNKAVNPPCAYTAYATCPLPPPQNRMTIAVTAGEKKYQEGEPHP
jgi:uncharacterized protein (DUF1684 family)